MLGRGFSKSLIEPYWLAVLWVVFILKNPSKIDYFNRKLQGFQKSCLNEILSERNMCVCLKPVRIYNNGAVSRVQPPRSRSSTGKTKKKKKLELNRSPTVWTTGVQSAAFGSVLILFGGVALRASVLHSLTSDRCLGARVFDPPLSPMIFFQRLAPRGCFLHWNGHGVFFPVVVCVNNKKSPRKGRFFSPVRPMRA